MGDMMCSQGCIQYAQSSCKIPKPCLLSDGLAYMGEHLVAGQRKPLASRFSPTLRRRAAERGVAVRPNSQSTVQPSIRGGQWERQ